MPQYELRYLCGRDVREIVDVPDPDEAELLARRRLLFTDPGFAIAILCEGVELNRVTQRSKAPAPRGFSDNTDAASLAAHALSVAPKIEGHLRMAEQLKTSSAG